MAVITYSRAKEGNTYLSPHFRVEEFACKDGSDTVLVSTELVTMLEKLREALGADSVKINSGYRTKAHNAKIGGSKTSKHCKGQAADIICKKGGKSIPAKTVCCTAQDLGFKGVAYIGSYATHVDMRTVGTFRVDESKNYRKVSNWHTYFNGNPYAEPVLTVKRGSKGNGVKWVQYQLRQAGYKLTVDGSFGAATQLAVKAFQQRGGLSVDGSVGRKTRAALGRV